MVKNLLTILLIFSGFWSFTHGQNLAENTLVTDNFLIITKKYKRISNVIPYSKEQYLLSVEIINNNPQPVLIDFDDMFIVDDRNNYLRVEFVSGKNHDEKGKIFWTLPARSRRKKKIAFIIDKNNDAKILKFKEYETKLVPATTIINNTKVLKKS